MMNSLFESFDPLMSPMKSNLLVFWLPLLFPIYSNFFMKFSRNLNTGHAINNFMFNELSACLNNKNKQQNIMWLLSIFSIILSMNIMGLIPYVYTMTSQMMFTLSLALPFWIAPLFFTLIYNTSHFFSHLVPLSTPLPLSQFMTIIESISQMIRPITLSVRLCANMTAGHILMALTSKPIFIFNYFSLILTILLILEIAVAFIQSYVFTMLLTMYLSES